MIVINSEIARSAHQNVCDMIGGVHTNSEPHKRARKASLLNTVEGILKRVMQYQPSSVRV